MIKDILNVCAWFCFGWYIGGAICNILDYIADLFEMRRKEMNKKEAYDLLCKAYLSNCSACDECEAYWYCVENDLRTARYPQADCPEKLKAYFRSIRINKR